MKIVEEEMATKTMGKTTSYEVDYKAAIAEIKKLEQKLATIKGKVSAKSRAKISLQLGILKTVESFCAAAPRMKMSKGCLEAPPKKMSKFYV
jgi:hypothetical protein